MWSYLSAYAPSKKTAVCGLFSVKSTQTRLNRTTLLKLGNRMPGIFNL